MRSCLLRFRRILFSLVRPRDLLGGWGCKYVDVIKIRSQFRPVNISNTGIFQLYRRLGFNLYLQDLYHVSSYWCC